MTLAKHSFENLLKFYGLEEILCGQVFRDSHKVVEVRFTNTTVSLYSFSGYYHPMKKEGEWFITHRDKKAFEECLERVLNKYSINKWAKYNRSLFD